MPPPRYISEPDFIISEDMTVAEYAEIATENLKIGLETNLPERYSNSTEYLNDVRYDFPWEYEPAMNTIEMIKSNPKLFIVWEEATKIIGFDVLEYFKHIFDQEK